MKKGLIVLVCLVICGLLLFNKETHETVIIKVIMQAMLIAIVGIIFFVGHYLLYDLPKKLRKKKYEQNYPISNDKLSLKYLSKGDIVLLNGYGKGIYDGKDILSKKHTVWIKGEKQSIMKEFSEQELLVLTQQVSCEFGLKWERKNEKV